MVHELAPLRTKTKLRAVKAALRKTNASRTDFRVVHFSLQSTHLHLIVEAESRDALSRGVRALEISLARRLNAIAGRSGRAFGDRYHARALTTPRETRNALAYVLLNHRRHGGAGSGRAYIDPCSSGAAFEGWSRPCSLPPGYVDDGVCVEAATKWLLKTGWLRHHPRISVDEVPGPL